MDSIVTARVPSGIKEQGADVLKSIGHTPTELINAAYKYVIEKRELPTVNAEPLADPDIKRRLTKKQASSIRKQIEATTFEIPDSFWMKSDDELLTEALEGKYARTN